MEKTDRGSTCFFTGHRSIPDEVMTPLLAEVDGTIESLYGEGFRNFVCGGAVGFDTIAACRVAVAAKKHPDIRFILVLPCRDQTSRWRRTVDLSLYQRIKGFADDVIYARDMYAEGCMHERNRMMADMSSTCVAYYNGARLGGTAYTVRYAEGEGLRIVNLFDRMVTERSGKTS